MKVDGSVKVSENLTKHKKESPTDVGSISSRGFRQSVVVRQRMIGMRCFFLS